jgi:hypothetical protein
MLRNMTRTLLALGGAALAVLMLSAVLTPADARGRHGFQGWSGPRYNVGPRFYSGPHVYSGDHSRYRPFRRHRDIFVGGPLIYGSYYYGSCSWLRYRALRTGSPYWWERYHACMYEY